MCKVCPRLTPFTGLLRYAKQYRCHRLPVSVSGRCFLTPRSYVWPPSLQRNYPPSSVLVGHPTPRASSAFLPLRLFRYTPLARRNAGSPGLPCNHFIKHAMVSTPGAASTFLPITSMLVLTSCLCTQSSFPSSHLRGSIPSALRLTACLLAVLS